MKNTIVIPLIALTFVLIFAVFIAYLVVRKKSKVTAVIDTVSMVPYIVPGIVVGIALSSTFNKPPLVLTGSMTIMVIALIIRRLPYTIRSTVATLQQIPLTVEEASLSLGASNAKTFWKNYNSNDVSRNYFRSYFILDYYDFRIVICNFIVYWKNKNFNN